MNMKYALIFFLWAMLGATVSAAEGQRLLAGDSMYRLTKGYEFYFSPDSGASWEKRTKGLPERIVYPWNGPTPARLTSLGTDAVRRNRVAVSAPQAIYLSSDSGKTWERIDIKPPIGTAAYITAVSLSPHNDNAILIGTSFNGIFESTDRGKTWQDITKDIKFLAKGAGFYEEISAIAYHPVDKNIIFFATGFAKGLFQYDKAKKKWSSLEFPRGTDGGFFVSALSFSAQQVGDKKQWLLQVRNDASMWIYSIEDKRWNLVERGEPSSLFPEEKDLRMRKAADKYGIYLAASQAEGAQLDKHIAFLKEHGLNSIVVDMKDDYGYVTYDTALDLPKKVGAVKERFKAADFVSKAHAEGLYVIGRIVVFKDERLYQYDNKAYALWRKSKDTAWGYFKRIVDAEGKENFVQSEFWVDPYSDFVWKYNIDLAKELESMGFDEIQFDYIRFPSDGDVEDIKYRHNTKGLQRVDALESFLAMARESIRIPISTDVYGFNAWYRMEYLGQNIAMLSEYVDVISPMFYPSHFERNFLKDMAYLDRALRIYEEGSARANAIVEGRSLIRPYVQAFLIGGELEFDQKKYSKYLTNQISGALLAGASGFTLWNASNRYYMVTENLKIYTHANGVLGKAVPQPSASKRLLD